MPLSGDQLSKDLTLSEFRQFRDYIHEHSGIFLEDSKADSLRISLVTRATRLDCETWDRYFQTLSSDEAEFRELMSLVTINETSFFRFPAQFDVLRGQVLPELAQAAAEDKHNLRVWSAGCSTGEEPYSVAMAFLESGLATMGWKCEVVGTDVSTKALNQARQGIYPAKSVLNIPEDSVKRFFVPDGTDSYRVSREARNLCEFSYHNLIKEPYPVALMGNWDIVFCRNVTIYFRLESTKRVVSNFFRSLNEGGYLFIGHSETLSSISDEFELVEMGGVFIYRKPRKAHRVFFAGSGGHARKHDRAAAEAARRAKTPGRGEVRVSGGRRRAKSDAAQAPAAAPSPEFDIAEELVRAHEAMAAGEAHSALEAAERVLAVDDNNAEAHLVAAHAHADADYFDEATADCTRALAINPLLPGARYILGLIHQRQGDAVRAVSELKKTIYIDPDFALAHLNLGNIYKNTGRHDAAVRAYENALRAIYKNPEGSWTMYLGGWQPDVIVKTCERSLLECRKAMGAA